MLDGKAALVTGAARGIGRAAALAMAREGARVVVADLLADGAKETVALIEEAGGRATAVAGDVTKPELVKDWIEQVRSSYGRIDCAFNNAGVPGRAVGADGLRIADWPDDAFDRMIEVNLKSVWLCMKEEIHAMVADGKGGSIVNMSSISSLVAIPSSGIYGAAKHGVNGLTMIAASEYATDGVRVNAIAPGYIQTEIGRPHLERMGAEIARTVPAGVAGTVEDVAELAVWLCSDRSSYITGQNIVIDGGYIIR